MCNLIAANTTNTSANQPTDLIANQLSEAELMLWLQLDNVPKMGFFRLSQAASLLQCNLVDLPYESSTNLQSIGFTSEQVDAMSARHRRVQQQYKKACTWLNQSDQHGFISLDCTQYPVLLKTIDRPPMFLFTHGNQSLMHQPQLAIVGSRAPSLYAKQVTFELIQQLSIKTNAATISGVALGIDAACHKASIANKVNTIGVLGCGIDVVYPKRHHQLYEEIKQHGLLVSEFLPGTKPVASMFPRRNRIISGMSIGTLVVEAKIKSGSLVTAKYALEQNREVFAVPNNITNPNAKGCHWLIKQGATLVDDIEDIIAELPSIALPLDNDELPNKLKKNQIEHLASDPLLDSVNYSATPVDEIAKRTGMSLSDVLSQLLEYELRGIVASTAEGYIKLRG
ncbi:MAG: DNA-processing protein DprA [Glaciecola sp.]